MQHFSENFKIMLHFGKIPKKFGENLARFSKNSAKFWQNLQNSLKKQQKRVGNRERGLQSQQRETKKERGAWGSFSKNEEVSQG